MFHWALISQPGLAFRVLRLNMSLSFAVCPAMRRHLVILRLPGPARFPEKALLQTHSGLLATCGPQTRVRATLHTRLRPESSRVSGRLGPSQEAGGGRPRLARSRDVGDRTQAETWPRSHEAGPRAQTDARTATSRESAGHGRAPEGLQDARRVRALGLRWSHRRRPAARGPGSLRRDRGPVGELGARADRRAAARRGCPGSLSCTL